VKTAATIEAQEERKKDEKDNVFCAHNSTPVSTKKPRDGTKRLKPFRFQPGVSGNPGGRPKTDVASEIAQALFTNNPELIYEAFLKVLRKGSPYGFQVLADRAFGRLKETHAIEHSPYKDVSDEDLRKSIEELKRKLGWPGSEPQILPPADDSKVQ
jgi:hypothetical protein